MIRYLIGVFALAWGVVLAFADDLPAAKSGPKSSSMRFEWRTEGPAEVCGSRCRSWISATGVVTEASARDFEAFARDNDVRGATLVLDSEGGSVLAAMALGRAIRRFDITTTVGRTAPLAPEDGGPARVSLSPKATCESMCAFILIGGTRRYVPPEARVLVHEIWLGSKAKHALDQTYTAEELSLVQRDIGSLARYTVEMGAGIELLEAALRVPPWEPMHALTNDEMRRMRVTTVENLFEPNMAARPAPTASANALTTAAQAQHGRD